MNTKHNKLPNLSFSTAKEMLDYARAHPEAVREQWWSFYVTTKSFIPTRFVKGNKNDSELIEEMYDTPYFYSYKYLITNCKPIPCPHFIFATKLSVTDFVPENIITDYLGESIPLTHREIFCINNAWKLTKEQVYAEMSSYISSSVVATLCALQNDFYAKTGYNLAILENGVNQAQQQILYAMRFYYARYVAQHAAIGLLNKELFD